MIPEVIGTPSLCGPIVLALVCKSASPHTRSFRDRADYNPLREFIEDARLVVLGEASHGTREFYRERAQNTEEELGEDWPDAYRVAGWGWVEARSLADTRIGSS
jgi:hypothetical protein